MSGILTVSLIDDQGKTTKYIARSRFVSTPFQEKSFRYGDTTALIAWLEDEMQQNLSHGYKINSAETRADGAILVDLADKTIYSCNSYSGLSRIFASELGVACRSPKYGEIALRHEMFGDIVQASIHGGEWIKVPHDEIDSEDDFVKFIERIAVEPSSVPFALKQRRSFKLVELMIDYPAWEVIELPFARKNSLSKIQDAMAKKSEAASLSANNNPKMK